MTEIHSCSFILQELAGRAREGKLKPHEYQGGSFTLVDCDKTATPRLGPGLQLHSARNLTLKVFRQKPLPLGIHYTAMNVTDGALPLTCFMYYAVLLPSAVYQTWVCSE